MTSNTCANAFDIAPSADIAPPVADEADNVADTDAGAYILACHRS